MHASTQSLAQSSYAEEPVRFDDGTTSLSGVLCRPDKPPPYPAVVFIHGSGPTTRYGYTNMYPQIWDAFAQRGIASLAWDKPGVGESTGEWRTQDAFDRAREGLAAIRFLRQRADIVADKIGLWGTSQAGWIMPIIYEMAPQAIAFIVASSVPVGGEEQELFRVVHQLPADGYSPADTEKALAFSELRFEFGHRDLPYESYAKLQKLVEDAPWLNEVGAMGVEDYAGFKLSIKPDPREKPVKDYLRQIRCPVLALFGGRDTIVNLTESMEVYTTALQMAGNRDVTIKLFADGDHCLFESQTGGMKEMGQWWEKPVKLFATGYLDTMADWLEQRFCRL
jgi:uncharacterized protein